MLLALACLWKYPALILVFVLSLDALRSGRRPWRAILTFGLIFGGVQLGLAALYGAPHLLHVLDSLAAGKVINRITVHPEARKSALLALDRMLALTGAGKPSAQPDTALTTALAPSLTD